MALKLPRFSTVILPAVTTLYIIISKLIFDKIYLTSKIIVDEEFHLPLGEAYCQYDFNKWDPKVTTFPGLYLLSSLLLSKFGLCTTYWLRFVSLLSSVVNIILFYLVLKLFHREVAWKTVISAFNLSILPPLYFFSHVYYTDISSIMMTMLLIISARKENHYLASFFGALAILMRQTNVIWIGMLFGDHLLKQLYMLSSDGRKYMKQMKIPMKGVQHLTKMMTKPADILKKTDVKLILDCLSYISVISSFLVFVYLNGSIVVGDKTAHEATIHFAQVFYFATFTLVFGWPHFLENILPFVKFTWNNKFIILASIALCLCVIHFNTLVHPYMLADNRHYVFYVWNRFYGKYYIFRYCMVPVYIFALYGIISKIWNNSDISFPLMYILCTVVVLVMQKLVEFRYYLFPYILFRIQIKKSTSTILALESLTYIILNAFTLYVFFNKSIIWDTYDYPQRLTW